MSNLVKNRSGEGQSDTLLRKPWSTIARAAWLAVVLLIMALFAYGLLVGLNQLQTVCSGEACHPSQLDPALSELNQQLGLSLEFYAWFTTLTYALFGSAFFAIAWLIFWQRSNDWMALFVSLFLVLMGAGANPVIPNFGPAFLVLASAGVFPLLCLFPDGRFVPRWTRWLVLGWILFYGVILTVTGVPTRGISSGPPNPILQGALLIGIFSQVYRYRRVSNPLQRQQTKWAVFGFAGWILCLVALLLALALYPSLRGPGLLGFAYNRYGFAFVGLLPVLSLPAGIGIAILRYRLWDIDIIIRRTLQYTLLTGILALIYFGGVVAIQAGVGALTGQEESPIIIVLNTLIIAALFNPLRNRIQGFIDQRFYRKKYDAEQALAKFASTARDEVDFDELNTAMLSVVEETVQPETTSLWIKDPDLYIRSYVKKVSHPN